MKTRGVGRVLFGALLLNCLLDLVANVEAVSDSELRRPSAALLQRSKLLRRIRSPAVHRNESESRKQYKVVYSIARRPGPAKRDFQDHNPPKTPEELYSRYDPSVAVSTGVVLGGMLGFIVGRVMLKCVVKMTKRQLRKTKRFAKYFPERELPPLHVAQQIAREHGIALPESLISKLVRAGSEANLRRIADAAKSPAAITAAAISPLILQQQQPSPGSAPSPSAGELLGLIRVNIIGATPSITPNASHKILPALAVVEKRSADQQVTRDPAGENGHVGTKSVDSETRAKNALVVTTATIETQPLLLSTTTSTMPTSCGKNGSFSGGGGGGISSSRTSSNFSNNLLTGNRMSIEARLPAVHRPTFGGRTVSSSSYCLSNGGGAIMNAGVLDRRKLMED